MFQLFIWYHAYTHSSTHTNTWPEKAPWKKMQFLLEKLIFIAMSVCEHLLYHNISPVGSVTDRQINQGFVPKAGCLLAEILICIIVGLDQQSLVHKNIWAKDVDRSLQLYEEPSWRFPIAPMASRDSVPISLGNDGEMTRKGIYFSYVLQ